MNCSKIMELVYGYSENDNSEGQLFHEGLIHFFNQIQIGLHAFFCNDCAKKIAQYENALLILREDFFLQPPHLEEAIMAKITQMEKEEQSEAQNIYVIPGGISTRAWVIAGIIIMVSLVTAFFGFDFQNLASESGASFLLPMGITIGCILTTYGALFIGSHLKELTERFGL